MKRNDSGFGNLKEKVIRFQRSGLKVLWILNGIKLSMWGLYLDVPDGTRKCDIDFSILRNAPLNH